jgi:hypothetical protein
MLRADDGPGLAGLRKLRQAPPPADEQLHHQEHDEHQEHDAEPERCPAVRETGPLTSRARQKCQRCATTEHPDTSDTVTPTDTATHRPDHHHTHRTPHLLQPLIQTTPRHS